MDSKSVSQGYKGQNDEGPRENIAWELIRAPCIYIHVRQAYIALALMWYNSWAFHNPHTEPFPQFVRFQGVMLIKYNAVVH